MNKAKAQPRQPINKLHAFFEKPRGFLARLTQFIIFLLIIASVGAVVIEFFYKDIFAQYESELLLLNSVALVVFTIEYLLRIASAPKKSRWARRPLNIVDFFAVFPNYLELLLPLVLDTTGLRGLRLLRILRFTRMIRVLRLFRFGKLLKKVFRYQKTILQTITPVIILFIGLKLGIWALEHYGYWFVNSSLGELFAIIGFALGIILSQKIGVSYDKFIQVEEAAIRLYGTLRSLTLILDKIKPGLGSNASQAWAQSFLKLLENPKADNYAIHEANKSLYDAISQAEKIPSELAILHGDVCRDAAFCLSKKVRLTPKAYDTLLHQSTMLYLGLIAIFIPGLTGIISVFVATYILYGMYNLTQDFDSIVGGDFDLININIAEIEFLAKGGGK